MRTLQRRRRDLIEVEYDVLPHVLTAPDAMRADAPILHECLRTNELGVLGDVPTNVASHSQIQRGDVEAGFADAAAVVERRFVTQTVHQGYIEPHTATAQWNAGGHLHDLVQHAGQPLDTGAGGRAPATAACRRLR